MEQVGRELTTKLGRYHTIVLKPEIKKLTELYRQVSFNLYLVSSGPFSRIASSAEKLGYLEVDGEIQLIKDNPGAMDIMPNDKKLLCSFSKTMESSVPFSRVKALLNTDVTIDGVFVSQALIEGVLVLD